MNAVARTEVLDNEAAVSLQDVTKRYGSFAALEDVSLSLHAGEIHAFVGQNGAGKSTCLGLLAARTHVTSGTIRIGSTEYPQHPSPQQALRAGVATIYQELTVLPAMSAMDNVFLGRFPAKFTVLRRREQVARFLRLCAQLGVDIAPDVAAGNLSIGEQQVLEIMRALLMASPVLLLDEPTAVLSHVERETLFRILDDLRRDGVCIVLVSHYLDEVLTHADRATVFRDGRVIESRRTTDWTQKELVERMLGNEAALMSTGPQAPGEVDHDRASVEAVPPVAFAVRGLNVGKVADVSLELRRGEIVGVAGLMKSGRSTLIRALAGVQRASSGEVFVAGQWRPSPKSPREARAMSIGYIPEDRKAVGLVMSMSGTDNLLIGNYEIASRGGMVRRKAVDAVAGRVGAEYGLPRQMASRPAANLSGGNQQKLLFGRSNISAPTVLLADEATRGIDIGAKVQIIETLMRLASSGAAILLVTSDLEELAATCSRVYVMRHGAIVCELRGAGEITEHNMLSAAFGGDGAAISGGAATNGDSYVD